MSAHPYTRWSSVRRRRSNRYHYHGQCVPPGLMKFREATVSAHRTDDLAGACISVTSKECRHQEPCSPSTTGLLRCPARPLHPSSAVRMPASTSESPNQRGRRFRMQAGRVSMRGRQPESTQSRKGGTAAQLHEGHLGASGSASENDGNACPSYPGGRKSHPINLPALQGLLRRQTPPLGSDPAGRA
jgi:hypothetical protein